MLNRRFHLFGLFAVLLALMGQLGAGASVPRIDPIATAGVLCHSEDEAGGGRSKAPSHGDCLVCPLCVAVHTAPAALVSVVAAPMPRDAGVIVKAELPPPSTAPSAAQRPPSQPRAPPTYS
ncbi:MAG: hypothetical protein QOF70_2914 [Acetobacteraceae bacterium]|nr:hypothetical protein [Acetobacteraceae bacterium]